jgi:hypothetical protein
MADGFGTEVALKAIKRNIPEATLNLKSLEQ